MHLENFFFNIEKNTTGYQRLTETNGQLFSFGMAKSSPKRESFFVKTLCRISYCRIFASLFVRKNDTGKSRERIHLI